MASGEAVRRRTAANWYGSHEEVELSRGAPGLDRCNSWLGCDGGSTPTSWVTGTGGAGDGRGRMGELLGREKKERENGKRKYLIFGFFGFSKPVYILL